MTIFIRRLIYRSVIAFAFGCQEDADRAEPPDQIGNTRDIGNPAQKLRELKLPRSPVASLEFSPDGRMLIAVYLDRPVRYGLGEYHKFRTWTVADFRTHYDLDPKEKVGGFAFAADSELLLIGTGPSRASLQSLSGEIQFWDMNSGKMRGKPYSVENGVNSLACSPDGKTIALGSAGGEVGLFDYDALLHGRTKRGDFGVRPENRLEEDGGGRTMIYLKYSSDGRNLAALASSKRLTIWDTSANRIRYKVKDWVSYLAFSPNNNLLAVGIQPRTDGPVTYKILRVQDGVQIGELAASHNADLEFSRDGKLFATGSAGGVEYIQGEGGKEIAGEVKIWDVKTLRPLQTLDSSAIGPIAFSPKEGLLATATKTGSVAIWKVRPGT
jgi:WD40 repeat protein